MIDVTHRINAVRRQVGKRDFKAGEARVVVVSQTYDAPLDDVRDACTDPERIPRWFPPVEGELPPGGHYQLQGNAGGTVERCDPPKSFLATWEFGGEVSWIELRLAPQGEDATRFELEHIAHVDDTKWAEFGPGAVGGRLGHGARGAVPAPGHRRTGRPGRGHGPVRLRGGPPLRHREQRGLGCGEHRGR
ncbi:SRPBCC family protein [Streptomyces adustus]|uniref:SRPBCC family protein n=1 Tax=Streptomyces adustus TaxID=1609272 RepID=UPI0030846677